MAATLILGTAGWALSAHACDDSKTQASAASATTKEHACTAEMAAKCTPAQAAACKAKGTSAATASHEACKTKGTSATTASYEGRKAKGMSAASDCCKAKGASATTAAVEKRMVSCDAHAKGAKGTHAEAAVYMGSGSEAKAAGSGSCSGRGFTAAIEKFNHNGCDACADLSLCDQELKSASSVAQVVKLKNGVMYVHTASSPSDVRALQSAMTRRNERLVAMSAAGEKAKLCPDCKAMRGAMASGKLTREMVAIEGGCLTLMTSTDPSMINRLHSLAGLQSSARIKS